MSPVRHGTLEVPGAQLYFEVRGDGPALLCVPTGNGDATPFGPLADTLATRHTVITYDRRGFSRSPVFEAVVDHRRVEVDARDARHLLDHVVDGPADVFGTCSGGIVALALLQAHPHRLRTVVVHEPPLASVLPDAAHWLAFYDNLYLTYREHGIEAAREMFRDHVGLAGETRPPRDAELPPEQLAQLQARLRRNQVFWFEHETRTFPAYRPDPALLRRYAAQLVLAGGSTSREQYAYRPNQALARLLGLTMVDFPGGHVGHVTHPYEFADRLVDVLRHAAARIRLTGRP
ncbi:Pimeloyl-ACP methyl ester carboxylesterase [Micromonospora phaseoli]|uniref:Pimeloyl-ACP methyl ester carboxylesterase n=1 Tax=Micromonospora phaseoli TaxID=1144548 RepID=A0A1H7BX18_9ACTN|nr:alpha/beta fold hydrolase [Micromonospora phaseoli]PZV92771.1 pimeloyl-ACP methyl ester carboxylesterase [Micromonospora phaseoli]GIJ76572.1 putative hydrolase YraK [Micromonospora phaseoli]SEJ82119.1 Pimeloyl-ACP methyl ester carboxylesterase [Micromonospora phaseoli]